MSRLSEESASPPVLSSLIRLGLVLAFAICLLALAMVSLMGRPTQNALADTEPTVSPSPTPSPTTDWPRTTPAPISSPTVAEPVGSATVKPAPVATRTAASPTPSPTRVPVRHVVRKGETLSTVGRAYGVSVSSLIAANDLRDPDLLYVGQQILLPKGAVTAVPDTDSTQVTSSEGVSDQPAPMPSLGSPDEMIRGRWIDVDLSEQRLTAYDASTPVRSTLVSTGLPDTPTPVGLFRIWIKLRYDDMAGADYYIEDVPYVMYFHEGYGLHGVTWHGNFGRPMSHGCVNLPTSEAEWLFHWAEVGTPVIIRE